ncbi:hypothetical protein PM082_009113 [Marasmius tenuissimus]|nr:hypothetical protein PM082_009113 [Marasmius tenuissimus]
MFWAGPFTDKPYLALLSFLLTQNTGNHLQDWPASPRVCRPPFWLWINPGPAAAVPNPNALGDMYESLKANPWAAAFLHPHFKDVIKFKTWNMTSSSTYDGLLVILSDMARFVLYHRFGGIYLDADTVFLRNWEELWGWKGGFAYRWSRLERVQHRRLGMHRNSALGSFSFRTALKNGLDFHPVTVSRYLADAYLEDLLLRLPDTLFDSAWLNTHQALEYAMKQALTSFEDETRAHDDSDPLLDSIAKSAAPDADRLNDIPEASSQIEFNPSTSLETNIQLLESPSSRARQESSSRTIPRPSPTLHYRFLFAKMACTAVREPLSDTSPASGAKSLA